MQLKNISFEPPQLDIFLQFFDKMQIFEGKKKKRAANITQPVVLWSIIWQTLCCKIFASHSQPGEQKSPTRHSCLVWGIQPGHPVLAVWFGSCSSAPDNRSLQRRVVLKQLPPLGTVSTVSILTVPTCSCHPGEMQDGPEDFTSDPTCGFFPPKQSCAGRNSLERTHTAFQGPALILQSSHQKAVGRTGLFQSSRVCLGRGLQTHSASQGVSAEGRKAPSPSHWRINSSKMLSKSPRSLLHTKFMCSGANNLGNGLA